MCGTDIREDPNLTPATEASRACCSTDAETAAPADASDMAHGLEGLTCGHCVQSVETAVSAVAGVESASVELVTGGTSTLTVSGPADPVAVRAAIATAGYFVMGS